MYPGTPVGSFDVVGALEENECGSAVPANDPITFAVVTNEGYKRVDLAVAYSWPLSGYVRRLKIFARIENLFDERYDEVLGFGSRPTNFLAGVGGEL